MAKKPRRRIAKVPLEAGLYRRATLKAKREGFANLAEALAELVDRYTPEQMCRKCGCSQYDACEEGCSWVEFDLCSACK